MTIQQYYENAKAIKLDNVIVETMEEQEEDIIALNQYQLYIHSEDADKEPLARYKNNIYALEKNEMNPQVGLGNPDLNYTGSFYMKMYLTVRKRSFEIDSTDEKSSALKDKYGDKIFGLSKDSIAMYTKDYFKRLFFQKIKEALR